MARKVWQCAGFQYRFTSRELAERFRCYWPGHVGLPEPVDHKPFDPPVWDVITNAGYADMVLYVENRSVPYHF